MKRSIRAYFMVKTKDSDDVLESKAENSKEHRESDSVNIRYQRIFL